MTMNTDKLVLLHGSLKNICGCMIVVFRLGLLKTNLFRIKEVKKELKAASLGLKNGGFCKRKNIYIYIFIRKSLT